MSLSRTDADLQSGGQEMVAEWARPMIGNQAQLKLQGQWKLSACSALDIVRMSDYRQVGGTMGIRVLGVHSFVGSR